MHTIFLFTQSYCINTLKTPTLFYPCGMKIREWVNVLYKIIWCT